MENISTSIITKLKNMKNKSIILILFLLLFSINSFSQIIPMPIPYDSSGGDMDKMGLLALVISINIVLISIFFIRLLFWLFNKDQRQFYNFIEYCIWGDNFLTPQITTAVFCIINGIAFLFWFADIIYNLIK